MSKKSNKQDINTILEKYNQGIKLDIGCGFNKKGPDWVGIDMAEIPGVNIIHDLEKFPWPLPDECAKVAVASHIVEHINPAGGVFLKFMDEVWRVLKPDGELLISTPYAGSIGYFQDPTHVNPCNEFTWEYFDPLAPHGKQILYRFYKPKPWKIKYCSWNVIGNIEVVLIKRRIDKSYDN